jgi:hypothetical protein
MKLNLFLTLLLTTISSGSSACTTDDECATDNGFCGRDGNCTAFGCENWFQQGPVEFTGYDPANPVEISCSDYTSGAEDLANSMVYGCRPYSPGKKAPEAKSWAYFFNQECTAGDSFKCYQNKAGSDQFYQEFVGEAARLNIPSCDEGDFDNKLPLYWYLKEAHVVDKDGNVLQAWGQGRGMTESSTSLNAREADSTFYSTFSGSSGGGGSSSPAETTAGASSASSVGVKMALAAPFFGAVMIL